MAFVLISIAFFVERAIFDEPAVVGDKMSPDVTFGLKGGEKVKLEALQGKVVLLNFWASWCGPCLYEMPDLEKLHSKMSQHTDFVVVGASQDDTWKEIQAAVNRFGVSFEVVHDPGGEGALAFGTNKLPESYLLDRKGRIVQKWAGIQSWSSTSFVRRFQHVLAAKDE